MLEYLNQQPSVPAGYQQVYFDTKTGQYMRPNPAYKAYGVGSKQPRYISTGGPGANDTPKTPPIDFNKLPRQQIEQAQPYVRPNAPTQNTGSGYLPQFDPTFIQQMLAQRFGNQQPNTGMPAAVPQTLTPGAQQSYGGYQGQSGLAGLRSIANPAAMAPAGGTYNAPM